MRWLQTEYLLKGIFLGLLLDVALREAGNDVFNADAPLRVGLCIGGGLALALILAGLSKLWAGYRVRGRLLAFILFLLLESPGLVYTGILGGLVLGSLWLRDFQSDPLFLQMALGGAALGVVFWLLMVAAAVAKDWTAGKFNRGNTLRSNLGRAVQPLMF